MGAVKEHLLGEFDATTCRECGGEKDRNEDICKNCSSILEMDAVDDYDPELEDEWCDEAEDELFNEEEEE